MQADVKQKTDIGIADILLVEDEAILAMVASEVLTDAGYRVRECASSEEALVLLDSGYRPDVAIIDHGLPGRSGAELAAIISKDRPETAILIASGTVDAMDARFPLLPKPYRDAELVTRVAALLAELRQKQCPPDAVG